MPPIRIWSLFATLAVVAACGEGPGADDSANAVIEPPAQCNPGRPDCSVSQDFPDQSDLNATNSAGLRYSNVAQSLVIDRARVLPDADGDGVPDDADDCPGTPDWITPCDNDPTNDGVYGTVFYDPTGAEEAIRTGVADTTADIPQVDVYFLIDATPTLEEEIMRLQDDIHTIIGDIRDMFPDAQFGLGLYREYPVDDFAAPYSQAPFHHILDLTDDEVLMDKAVSTLNTVANSTLYTATAATQALYSVASGLGLGNMVPNRGSCPNVHVGYPCFRPDALHVVMNITDSEVNNGPDPGGAQYPDPPFPGVGVGGSSLPPVRMFPALFDADSAATALDLSGLAGQSLTLMGMSTLLTDEVTTAVLEGCDSSGDPPGADMDDKDVVLALGSPVPPFTAFANNTHWPGANLALFNDDEPLLGPAAALACDGGTMGVGDWGRIEWTLASSQGLYLVADGIIPAAEPGHEPEGAFSISIVYDDDPGNPAWQTSDAPVLWANIETELLASHIRVASVVTLRDVDTITSDGNDDARLIAAATDALTKAGGEWVWQLGSTNGEGLGAAVRNTIDFAKTQSVYTFVATVADNEDTGIDERDFILSLDAGYCSEGEPFGCESATANSCNECYITGDASLEYSMLLANDTVAPTSASQVFDFELVVRADDVIGADRIPIRVMVPDAASHEFDDTPEASFYRNAYDTTARCNTPPEHPKWGDLTWHASTPPGTSIQFQIRTANAMTFPIDEVAKVDIQTAATSGTFNLTTVLRDNGLPWGLPYLQIDAVLNASTNPPATPTLEGWSFEFFCEAAQ